jgi:hypothetical protein
MPVRVTPEEFANLWAQRLGASVDRIRAGVERVREAPGVRAAAAADRFRTRILEAIDTGRWQAEVSRVSLDQWKSAMLEKGVPRISAGAQAARPEMQQFATALFAHIEAGQRRLEAMPRVTLEDNINRVVTWVRHMAEFSWVPGAPRR